MNYRQRARTVAAVAFAAGAVPGTVTVLALPLGGWLPVGLGACAVSAVVFAAIPPFSCWVASVSPRPLRYGWRRAYLWYIVLGPVVSTVAALTSYALGAGALTLAAAEMVLALWLVALLAFLGAVFGEPHQGRAVSSP